MLWVALCFPHLALEARLRGCASPEATGAPWAIVEDRAVFACNAAARALGVRRGSALATAWTLAPHLRALPRDPAAEKQALEDMAVWAGQFTPRVSLEPPRAVLLEVESSLRLFGGAGRLIARLRRGLAELGFDALLATGPTARAALWLARGRAETLEALPIEAIEPAPEALELLRRLGIRTLGELMRLPRAGVAARCGQALLDALDRASGALPEPRAFFEPPERFSATLELPAPVSEADRVLFAARRLLVQMEGFLAARQAGVRRFTLGLLHRGRPATLLEVSFAAPRRDVEHALRLLRERLARLPLACPAETIRLGAEQLTPLAGVAPGLFGDACRDAEEWEQLTERLQARLGDARVHGLAMHAEHRPELAGRPVPPGAAGGPAQAAPGPRPLWLLEPPRPLNEGDFVLLAGPERIESGWWDGGDVRRDYYIAACGTSLGWIFRACEGWFLHGWFA